MTRMMNTESDELKYVEPIMDETCRGDHQWVFELNSTYLRAPRGGIEVCKNCGCLNEYTQTQVQGGEYGSDFNPESRLGWRARLPNFRERMDLPEQIRARTNVDQVFGMMYQDGLPKRAIRTARRLFFVYFADGSSHRCRTEADYRFCQSWTTHKRNKFLKEFGDYLPLPILLLARRLRTQQRWQKFSIDRDYRRLPKAHLKASSRKFRRKLKALVADICTLDPEIWSRDWNMKRRHELAFEFNGFLTRKQVKRLLACPAHPRSGK